MRQRDASTSNSRGGTHHDRQLTLVRRAGPTADRGIHDVNTLGRQLLGQLGCGTGLDGGVNGDDGARGGMLPQLTHHIAHLGMQAQPAWFAEGIASYFETATFDEDGRFTIGAVPRQAAAPAAAARRPSRTAGR